MSVRSRRTSFTAVVLGLSLLTTTISCQRRVEPEGETQAGSAATETLKPVAVVRVKDGPHSFSLDAAGLIGIAGPALASLTPFEPWPFARRIAGFVLRDGLIAGGANRDGFVAIVARKDGTAAVYSIFDPVRFDRYSIGSVFLDGTKPGLLLHRDRFFEESRNPSPDPRFFRLEDGASWPVRASIEAFGGFDATAGWDIEALERGEDGLWHARAVRSGGVLPDKSGEVSYLKFPSLHAAAEVSDSAVFQGSLSPRPVSGSDYVLARALRSAASLLETGRSGVVLAIAPGQERAIPYLLSGKNDRTAADAAEPTIRAWACSDGARAFLCLSDGSLIAAIGSDGPLLHSRLPALPDGFAYSGLAYTRGILAAAWEEQNGWAVGSAGFTLVDAQYFVDAALAASEGE